MSSGGVRVHNEDLLAVMFPEGAAREATIERANQFSALARRGQPARGRKNAKMAAAGTIGRARDVRRRQG